MSDFGPRDRHLDTVAAIDLVAGVSLVAVVAWLVAGISFAVNEAERILRLRGASVLTVVALGLVGLGVLLLRRARWAVRCQRWVAFAVLPLLPVGTAWGLYTLRVLGEPSEQQDSVKVGRSLQARPFWSLVAVGTAAGAAFLSFGMLKARELWLERQVEQAAASVAARQQEVSRHIEELRENGVLDTGAAAPAPRVRR